MTDEELLLLPTVDLHLHLVGSASPSTVADLAARHPAAGVPADLAALEQFYVFRDFPHFIDVYTAVSSLVRGGEDLQLLVEGLGQDLRAQGVPYAEVTVTPWTHEQNGIPASEVATALDAGAAAARHASGVELAWIYDISANDGEPGALGTLAAALDHPPAALVGFGLGGPEVGHPRADFAGVFAQARAAGLHSVPHAGETVGADEVWSAVRDLGAERIGHGIGAAEDPALLDVLRDRGIWLEVCPSSNVATSAVADLAQHPLPALLAAGVPVTLASDDPPMFGTSLLEEYRRARDVLGLGREELHALAMAGVRASFAPPATRDRLLRELAG
ncbi:aminodeoxyfutalosine deaminase [Motilibacter rhizosphaerae]|uniref:Aminodeoxyfutalosine deaminase n=1 Tax=Motilibacter rhizosphaerae TaxID=598652 RepID=A0A4Q7N742_9ACTN|nr:aminodeoxyfutalosine deaminase [Motilibacter rhizosphaerae]